MMWAPLPQSEGDEGRPPGGSDGAELWRPEGHAPPAAVLACTCSSLDPVLARLALPGERIWRSPGGAVAHPWVEAGQAPALGAVIAWLGVRDVVLLGHSRCEWVRQKYGNPTGDDQPAFMARVYRNVREGGRLRAKAMEHVLAQAVALRAHPALEGAVREGVVNVRPWLYLDETGGVLCYDPARGERRASLTQ